LIYLRNYAHRFFDETPFRVTINFPEQLQKVELNPELKRNLFLVMKEALNNAAKYSKAQHITLDFQCEGPDFTFIIADDGIGIEVGVVKGSGNGMINMRKRMESVNGRFDLQSAPGKGTTIILEGQLY
jgi:signal transduction histidine kinase